MKLQAQLKKGPSDEKHVFLGQNGRDQKDLNAFDCPQVENTKIHV